MIEYVGLVLVLPFASALVVTVLLRRRVQPLVVLGLGHAATVLVTVVRGLLGIPVSRSLGLFDPFLAILVGSVIILSVSHTCRATWRRLRARKL